MAREWWRELEWPEPETCGVVVVGLLENLCSLAMAYCRTLTSPRLQKLFCITAQPYTYFDTEFCWCLKSMSQVMEEVRQLSDVLGLEEVVKGLRKCGNSGAASQVNDTMLTLLSSVNQNLENLLDQHVGTAINQVVPRLREEVVEACEQGSNTMPASLTLTIRLLKERLLQSTPSQVSPISTESGPPCFSFLSSSSFPLFQRLLLQLWGAVVLQFMVTVAERTGKRPASYFCEVQSVLEATFSHFTSPGHLQPRAAATPGYRSLMEQVEEQKMSSNALILQYYHTRYTQQTQHTLPAVAHVLVRVFFSQPGHLTVRVLEVRDMTAAAAAATGGQMVQGSCRRGSQRYHVTVQVVPQEACPRATIHHTSTATHSPASFYETFEFPTGDGGGEGAAGMLQVTLELVRRSRSNGSFLGEAFMPLASLPYVDSPDLQNTTLWMTAPAFPPGYKSLAALRARAGDSERAAAFIKMMERRHPETRHNNQLGCPQAEP